MDDLGSRAAEAFRSLPKRYLGAVPGFDATYCIRLGDIGRSWEVRCTAHGARVRAGATRREPDVVIGTDAQTWLDLREGRLSGVEAFSQRRLYARGDLDLAVGFEGLFRLPNGRPPLLRIHQVPVGKLRISTLTMGEGPDLLLLHGLGSTKASFFETAAALSRNLPRACARPAGLRRLVASRPRRLTAPRTPPARCSGRWTRSGSRAPTSSATRWAGGSRWRSG